MNYHQTTAKNIRKYCRRKKITYSELARRADIPLRTLQGILYKLREEPQLSTVHSIAKGLKVKVDDLLK